jgi:hypothetical protein
MPDRASEMWRDIALNNRAALLAEMDRSFDQSGAITRAGLQELQLEALMQRSHDAKCCGWRASWITFAMSRFSLMGSLTHLKHPHRAPLSCRFYPLHRPAQKYFESHAVIGGLGRWRNGGAGFTEIG